MNQELEKSNKKCSLKIILRYFLYIVFVSFVLNYVLSNLFNNETNSIANKINTSFDVDFEQCEPILDNFNQFYVNFDGEIYPKQVPLYLNQSINFDCLNKSNDIKKILIWNGFFGDTSFTYGLGVRTPFIENNCPVTSCEILNDKSRLKESDYVIVHMRDGFDKIPTYPNRILNQRWIFVLYESPVHSSNYDYLNGLFNLTSTYRLDSNFSSLYQSFSQFYWSNSTDNSSDYDETFDYLKDKQGFATAVISNCYDSSNRLELIDDLKKFIQVDVYGYCGDDDCPNKYFYNESISGECKDILSKEYMFYFAFENSLCKDYATEKFFTVLHKYPIIPVVLGHLDYSHYVINYFLLLNSKRL